MGKNSVRKMNNQEVKNTTLMKVFKVIILIAFVIVVTCTVMFFVEMNQETKSYFTTHFALPCILFMVGIIATLMAALSMQNLSGESKGDNFMFVVGFLLMAIAIGTLIWSYF